MKRREFVETALAAGTAATVGLGWPVGAAAAKGKASGEIPAAQERFFATLPGLLEIAQLPGIGIGVVQRGKLAWKHHEGLANGGCEDADYVGVSVSGGVAEQQVFAYLALGWWTKELAMDKPAARVREGKMRQRGAGRKNHGAARVEPFERIAELEMGTTGRNSWPAFEPGQTFATQARDLLPDAVRGAHHGHGIEALVQERVMKPMGMNSSTYLWQAQDEGRWVAGHDRGSPENNTEARRKLFAAIEKTACRLRNGITDRMAAELMKLQDKKETPMPNDMVPNSAASLLTTVNDYGNFLDAHCCATGAAFEIKSKRGRR